MVSKYQSVTTIIGFFLDKRWFKPEHTQRGSKVHLMCELDIEDPLDSGAYIPDGLLGYYNSYLEWKQVILKDKIVLKKEPELKSEKFGLIGHPDLILADKNDRTNLTLVDYKTSKAKQPWWRLQLAVYKMMIDESDNVLGTVNEHGSLRVRDGKKPLYNSYNDSYEKDLETFMEALRTSEFFKIWNWK